MSSVPAKLINSLRSLTALMCVLPCIYLSFVEQFGSNLFRDGYYLLVGTFKRRAHLLLLLCKRPATLSLILQIVDMDGGD